MSSTRRAKSGSPMNQERFCSSSGFRRPLLGNLVARRAAKVRTHAGRELVYFLQDLSQRESHARHTTCNLFPAWPWPSTVEKEEAIFDRVARELAEMFPDSIPAAAIRSLPDLITRLCLDPSEPPEMAALPDGMQLFPLLRQYQAKFENASTGRLAMTETAR